MKGEWIEVDGVKWYIGPIEPPNAPFTGSTQLLGYNPKGRSWRKRALWYLRHPRETVARITGKGLDE